MRKISVILVGLGNIGLMYDYFKQQNTLTHFNAIKKNKNFKLVAGIDNDLKKKTFFKKVSKSPFFSNFLELKENIKCPDIIVISTSQKAKYSILEKIIELNWNPKLILFEKPLFENIYEKKKFEILERKLPKSKIMVNFIWRASQSIIEIKEKFMTKTKEKIVGHCFFTKEFSHHGCHCLDLILFLTNSYNSSCIKFKKFEKNYRLTTKKIDIIFSPVPKNINEFNFSLLSKNAKVFFDGFQNQIIFFKKNKIKQFSDDPKYYLETKRLKLDIFDYQKNIYKDIFKLFNKQKTRICFSNEGKINANLILNAEKK